jgi:hypothetical protein
VKNKRLFGIINTLNILLWIAFIVNRIWVYYGDTYFSDHDDSLFIVLAILSTIVFLFCFFCYKLIKTFRTAPPLSDSSRLIGPIIVILFTILTMIFDWIAVTQFKYYFSYRFWNFDSRTMMDLVLLALGITSTYLCIAYWIIRKRIQTQLTGIIADLGKREQIN